MSFVSHSTTDELDWIGIHREQFVFPTFIIMSLYGVSLLSVRIDPAQMQETVAFMLTRECTRCPGWSALVSCYIEHHLALRRLRQPDTYNVCGEWRSTIMMIGD